MLIWKYSWELVGWTNTFSGAFNINMESGKKHPCWSISLSLDWSPAVFSLSVKLTAGCGHSKGLSGEGRKHKMVRRERTVCAKKSYCLHVPPHSQYRSGHVFIRHLRIASLESWTGWQKLQLVQILDDESCNSRPTVGLENTVMLLNRQTYGQEVIYQGVLEKLVTNGHFKINIPPTMCYKLPWWPSIESSPHTYTIVPKIKFITSGLGMGQGILHDRNWQKWLSLKSGV